MQNLAAITDVYAGRRIIHATTRQVEPWSIVWKSVIGGYPVYGRCGILHNVGEVAPDFGRTVCLSAACRNVQGCMEAGRERIVIGIINLLGLW